jgi:hypothetical protein
MYFYLAALVLHPKMPTPMIISSQKWEKDAAFSRNSLFTLKASRERNPFSSLDGFVSSVQYQ